MQNYWVPEFFSYSEIWLLSYEFWLLSCQFFKQNIALQLFCQQPSLNTREERHHFYRAYVSNAIVPSHKGLCFKAGFQKGHRNAEERDKLEWPQTDQLGEAIYFTEEFTQILLNNTWILVKKTNPTVEKYITRPGSCHFCQVKAEKAKPVATTTHTLSSLHCTRYSCLPLSEWLW